MTGCQYQVRDSVRSTNGGYLTPKSALSFASEERLDEATRAGPASSPGFKALEAGRDGRKGCLALIIVS
jgi:hypothetical protein